MFIKCLIFKYNLIDHYLQIINISIIISNINISIIINIIPITQGKQVFSLSKCISVVKHIVTQVC